MTAAYGFKRTSSRHEGRGSPRSVVALNIEIQWNLAARNPASELASWCSSGTSDCGAPVEELLTSKLLSLLKISRSPDRDTTPDKTPGCSFNAAHDGRLAAFL